MTLDEVVGRIKTALKDGATLGVMTYLSAQVPFFALPVVNKITSLIVGWVIGIAVDQTELGAYNVYVDLYTAAEAAKFKEACAVRDAAVTPEQKALADEILIAAARTFIRLGA